jgi:hypothetical protein
MARAKDWLAAARETRLHTLDMDRTARRVSAVLILLAASVPVPAQPAATDFQLTPQSGQDDVQQWFDRYECDSRAKEPGSPPNQEQAGEEYRHAMVECLTQHGYGVSYAPPQPPPSAVPASYLWPGVQHAARELRYRALSVQAGGGVTAAVGSTSDYLHDGANAGAALTWFPSAALPLGVRVEGSYTWFKPGAALLGLNGVGYNRGQLDVYGGDVDLRLNLARLPARWQLYLFAGAGWYRSDTTLQKVSVERICGGRYCSVFTTLLAEEHDVSAWEPSWNAGLGWEVALDSHTSFFIEARYRRILLYSKATQLVPIWLGLRF